MKFENTVVTGFENAILGMRLPMCRDLTEAKEKSDSYCETISSDCTGECNSGVFKIGEKDLDLAKRLIKADKNGTGQPNSKFLRMINVSVCITAPLFFFKQLDTYKVSTVSNSTSTMHKLASTPITIDCFELEDYKGDTVIDDWWQNTIKNLEEWRQTVNCCTNNEDKKRYWKELVRALPESWLQARMWTANYEVLRSVYRWRKNHKLSEWHKFCEWVESLPYAKEFICSE